MSNKNRNRNSLLSSHNRSSHTNSTSKDELLKLKYLMETPNLPIYPLNDSSIINSKTNDNLKNSPYQKPKSQSQPQAQGQSQSQPENSLVYPDFMPWKDHTQLPQDETEIEHQKLSNVSYLNKGYFEPPQVANEYYSARNLIQATVFLSTDNCTNVINELSIHLSNAYKSRNEIINKIKFDSNKFKLPTRVTLTLSKKEIWLNELSNPNVSMTKLGEKIPHGIRNKVLIDCICTKKIPINRSIWFTKCVLYGELLALRRKHQNRLSTIPNNNSNTGGGGGGGGSGNSLTGMMDYNTAEKFEIHWLQEWTQQVSDYIYKFSREMNNIANLDGKNQYMGKLSYLLNYIQSLYVESLLDKSLFLSLIMKFLKDGLCLQSKYINGLIYSSMEENSDDYNDDDDDDDDEEDANNAENPESTSKSKKRNLAWMDEIDMNYGQRLVSLTLIKMFWNDILKFDYLSKELSELLLLNYFFINKLLLFSVNNDNGNSTAVIPDGLQSKILKLISDCVRYLFEYNCNIFIIPNHWTLIEPSLMRILLLDSKAKSEKEQEEIQKQLELVKYRNESLILNLKSELNNSNNTNNSSNLGTSKRSVRSGSFSNYTTTPIKPISNTTIEQDYSFINRNSDDVLNIVEKLDNLKLNKEFASFLKPTKKCNANWKLNLKVLLFWCVSPWRNSTNSNEDILFICNFLKNTVVKSLPKSLRTEFDNELLEIIYHIAEDNNSEEGDNLQFTSSRLYVLINELYQLKLITIASYLRKLIASGIFYLEPGSTVDQSLNNLPRIMEVHLKILENLPVLNNRQCDSILKRWTPMGFDFKGKFSQGQSILQDSIITKICNNQLTDDIDSQCIGYIDSLSVGLQFLLINWLTNELKLKIKSTNKLIHFTPTVITKLYQFYAKNSGLTVFFKVVIQTILKNDGGMIIFYLDSLYLISKLVIRHYKLIKSIAGASELSAAYDLFKLIIQVYKDLNTREYDCFKFSSIWNFINAVIEKSSPTSSATTTATTSVSISSLYLTMGKPKNSKLKSVQGLHVKQTMDSPMCINTVDESHTHDTRSGAKRYTSTDFRNDLYFLVTLQPRALTSEEKQEVFDLIEIELKDLDSALEFWYNNFELLGEEKEINLMKIIKSLAVTTYNDHLSQFNEKLKQFVISKVGESIDHSKLSNFLKKLAIFDLLRINDLVKLIQSIQRDEINHIDDTISFIYELIWGELDKAHFSCSQLVLLQISRRMYQEKSSYQCIILLQQRLLKNKESQLQTNPFFIKYKADLLSFFHKAIITNTKAIQSQFFDKLSHSDSLQLLNVLLQRQENEYINTIQDFSLFIKHINEFNLPICQVLLNVLFNNLVVDNDVGIKVQLEAFVNTLLQEIKFEFSNENSFFGELFNFMPWNQKNYILDILETKFLLETNLDNNQIKLIINDRNLLPPLNDFFKKFSSSSSSSTSSSSSSLVQTIETDSSFFLNLFNFIGNLVNVANSQELILEQANSINDTISIFLRILIIHKLYLCSMISRNTNEENVILFVTKLIDLLNSDYLTNHNDKLRILLYDLLLLMKSSVSEEVNSTRELNENLQGNRNGTGTGGGGSNAISPNQDSILDDQNTNSTGIGKGQKSQIGVTNNNDMLDVAPTVSLIQVLFDLPEPNASNPFKEFIDDKLVKCSIMLEEEELKYGGDYHIFNNTGLYLKSTKNESVSLPPFVTGLNKTAGDYDNSSARMIKQPFKMKSFEILEDVNNNKNSVNDGCINLRLFDAYTTKENPR